MPGQLDEIGLKAVIEGVGQYLANLDKMEKAEKDNAKAISDIEDKSKKMGSMLTKMSLVGTTAFAGLGVLAVKFAMDFENQMDQVGAVLQANDADMSKLKDTAKQLGADTAFSAGEAAKAMEELAAGGRSVAQIIGGEAQAAVSLAAAGNYDLANSAKTIATAMDIWKDSQISTNDVVNRLAGAANSSRFGVEDMSQAIASGGGVAAQAGVSFQDFSTVIAATASSFNSGSDAGTSFKTFITSLSGNSEKAKDMIKQLGLEFYTTSGTLKPMSEIVQQLNTAMAGLSQEQQTVALKTIFGNDAFRTAAGLMKMTGDEFSAMSDKMKNTNAADVAEQRMSNLSGTLEELTGSLETMAIQTGEMVLPMLNELAKVATIAVNAFAAMPQSSQSLVMGVTAVAVALPALISGLHKAQEGVKGLSTAMQSSTVKAGLWGAAIAAAVVGLDILLTKTTGHGLIDRIFGDVGEMEANNAALERFNAILLGLGPNADRVAAAQKELGRTAAESQGNLDGQSNHLQTIATILGGGLPGGNLIAHYATANSRILGFNVGLSDGNDKLNKYKETTKVLAQEMMSSGASLEALWAQYNKLPPELQKVFDAETQVVIAHEESARAASAGADVLERMVRDGLSPAGTSMKAFEVAASLAVTPLDHFNQSIEEGEDRTKAFEQALDTLAGRFSTFNPAVIATRGELAAVDEELADLERSGGEWSETLGMTKDELINVKKALEDKIALGEEDEAATKGMRDELKLYIGDGLLNLQSALRDSNLTLQEQIDTEILVGKALRALSEGDIPGFVKALDAVAKKSPEVAAVVVDNLGPGLQTKLEANIPGLVASGSAIGKAIADGLIIGMEMRSGDVSGTARRMINDAMGEIRIGAQTSSPSKLTYKIGVWVAKGLEEGIKDGTPAAAEAGAALARDVFTDIGTVITERAPVVAQSAQNYINMMINTMTENLELGKELTKIELSDLLESMYDLIARAPLSEAAQIAAQDTITAWVVGIGDGTGLANQAVIDLFTTIKGQIASSGADAVSEQKKWIDILTKGVGGATPIPWDMRPGAEHPGTSSIVPSTSHGLAALDIFRNASMPGPNGKTINYTDVGGILSALQQGWITGLDLNAWEKDAIASQYKNLGIKPPFQGFRFGTPFVAYDQLAMIHKGEAVVPAWANPYNGTRALAGGREGGGGVNITIDLSGATMTGTVDDNRRMLYDVVTDVIRQENGYQSAIAGVTRD